MENRLVTPNRKFIPEKETKGTWSFVIYGIDRTITTEEVIGLTGSILRCTSPEM